MEITCGYREYVVLLVKPQKFGKWGRVLLGNYHAHLLTPTHVPVMPYGSVLFTMRGSLLWRGQEKLYGYEPEKGGAFSM